MGEVGVELFWEALIALAHAKGAAPVSKHAGCWEVECGLWKIALNGHPRPMPCSLGIEVPRLSAYVEFNGWWAGLIEPTGGTIVAGEAANLSTLIEAMREATRA